MWLHFKICDWLQSRVHYRLKITGTLEENSFKIRFRKRRRGEIFKCKKNIDKSIFSQISTFKIEFQVEQGFSTYFIIEFPYKRNFKRVNIFLNYISCYSKVKFKIFISRFSSKGNTSVKSFQDRIKNVRKFFKEIKYFKNTYVKILKICSRSKQY